EPDRLLLARLLDNPGRARAQLAARLHEACMDHPWAPFWVRISTLLDRDVDDRSRMLSRRGLRRVLDELQPEDPLDERGSGTLRPHRPHRRSRRPRIPPHAERLPVARHRRDHRRAVAAHPCLRRNWHSRALADTSRAARTARTAARAR